MDVHPWSELSELPAWLCGNCTGGGLLVPILHANAMHHALKLVLHATLYSTCSILLYCVAGYTSNGLVYSLLCL